MLNLLLYWIVGILLSVRCITPLKDVRLSIEPKIVQRHGKSTLKCSYKFEEAGAVLYTIKWYRGSREFYRYTPSEKNPTKVFPVRGLNVDLSNSDSTQVTLTDIDFPISGKFSCEVTTEVPFSTGIDTQFFTGIDYQSMEVVKLPDYPPTISVGREPLDYGDILRANCSSSPSKPRTTLTFLLNNLTVAKSEPLTSSEAQKLSWSDLSLEITLTDFHFSDSGRLILQCIADIKDLYHEEAVLNLISARNPVPERVSAINDAPTTSSCKEALVVLVMYLTLFLS